MRSHSSNNNGFNYNAFSIIALIVASSVIANLDWGNKTTSDVTRDLTEENTQNDPVQTITGYCENDGIIIEMSASRAFGDINGKFKYGIARYSATETRPTFTFGDVYYTQDEATGQFVKQCSRNNAIASFIYE